MSRHQHHHHNPNHHPESKARPLHRSRIFIVAAILMLIGMLIYVLTMDEATVPIGSPNSPAVTTPAAP